MKAWVIRLVFAGLIASGLYWAWQAVFPGPERVVAKRMKEIRALVSFGPNEGALAKLSNSQQLVSRFTSDVEIVLDGGSYTVGIKGVDELRTAVMQARSRFTSLTVRFFDPVVRVEGEKAKVDVTARADIAGEKDPYIQELLFTFRKLGRDWLVSRVEPVKTLH